MRLIRRGRRARQLPIRRVPVVWHIGTEPGKPPRVVRFQDSMEGHALSVTTEPAAWQKIAKLGGSPWWQMRGPGRFLDVHRLDGRGVDKLVATRPDLAQRTTKWQAPIYDGETDEWGLFEVDTEEEAWAEVDDPAALPVSGDVGRVQSFRTWEATPKLNARRAEHGLNPADISNEVTTSVLIEIVKGMPDVDGLWWEDRLDPYALSAPRGALLPARLGRWRWERER